MKNTLKKIILKFILVNSFGKAFESATIFKNHFVLFLKFDWKSNITAWHHLTLRWSSLEHRDQLSAVCSIVVCLSTCEHFHTQKDLWRACPKPFWSHAHMHTNSHTGTHKQKKLRGSSFSIFSHDVKLQRRWSIGDIVQVREK